MSSIRGRAVVYRTCDICGRRREVQPGVFSTVRGRWTCNYHPFIAEEVRDAMPFLVFQAKAIPDSRPFDPRPSYQLAEEEILKLVELAYNRQGINATAAGAGDLAAIVATAGTVATSAWTAAWSCQYLYDLIVEARRPLAMIARARATLALAADFLLTRMEAGPGVTAGSGRLAGDTIPNSSAQPEWGGFSRDSDLDRFAGTTVLGDYQAVVSAAAGIALLRAFQLTADARYSAGARACAWFMRTVQCGDLLQTIPSTGDAAGANRKRWGALTDRMIFSSTNVAYLQSHRYYPDGLLGLRFLALYQAVVGDEVIGSATAGVTMPAGLGAYTFTGSRTALVSEAAAAIRSFWATPQPDAVAGAPVLGFSTTAPREAFDSFPAGKLGFPTGLGSWVWSDGTTAGVSISALPWAMGLRALYDVDGGSAFVTGAFDWLMGFTSEPTLELPAVNPLRMVSGYDDALVLAGTLGPYAPKTCLAKTLRVREDTTLAAAARNSSSFYDLGALGQLAPLYALRQATSFKEAKDALDQQRRLNMSAGRTLWLGTLGLCGLSFQPRSTAVASTARLQQLARVAMAGAIYRQQPSAYLGRGH